MRGHDNAGRGGTTRVSTPSNQIRSTVELHRCGAVPQDVTPKGGKARWAGNEYLRGPIPWLWLRSAYTITPSCLMVALGLWHWRALNKATTFKLTMNRLAEFVGLSYRTVQRMVKIMVEAGMIEVRRNPGSSHIFAIHEDLSANGGNED